MDKFGAQYNQEIGTPGCLAWNEREAIKVTAMVAKERASLLRAVRPRSSRVVNQEGIRFIINSSSAENVWSMGPRGRKQKKERKDPLLYSYVFVYISDTL